MGKTDGGCHRTMIFFFVQCMLTFPSTDWRHIRVEEHERSSFHLRCSTAHIVDRQQSRMSHLVAGSHRDEIRKRLQIMERVVGVVRDD